MRLRSWSMSKRVILLFMIIVLCLSAVKQYQKYEAVRFVVDMGAGWNLGNSLDAHKRGAGYAPRIYEEYWGNPVTTSEMMAEVKRAGFGTVRIPVTWYEHMDERGIIDQLWLERVSEVVDAVLDNQMYAIINIHHDPWFDPSEENAVRAEKQLRSCWSQITDYFAGYDERLLFEAMNEPRLTGTEYEWTAGTDAARAVVNRLNAAFVETIRTAGGSHKKRYLLVPTYCGYSDGEAINAMRLPKDKRLIISIHEYKPYDFALNDYGTTHWNADNPNDTGEIDRIMARLHKRFVRKGIPVIITEFGAVDKDNLQDRLSWTAYYVKAAQKHKVGYIWWDAGGHKDEKGRTQLFDRYRLTWTYPEIVRILTQSKIV